MRNNRKRRRRLKTPVVIFLAVVVIGLAAVIAVGVYKKNQVVSPSKVVLTSSKTKTGANIPKNGSSSKQSGKAASSKNQSSNPSKTPSKVTPSASNVKEPSAAVFKGAVFMGDSVTVDMVNYDETDNASVVASIGASAYRALTCHSVAVNGNKSDKTYMPDRVAAAHPKKIYMMFGANDLSWGAQMTVNKFIGYYGRLIDTVKSRCPNAKIFIQSILPITAAASSSNKFNYSNKRIELFNMAIKTMCRQRGLKYLDIASVIKGPDGSLPANESDDGLHLRSKEYKKWFSYLAANS